MAAPIIAGFAAALLADSDKFRALSELKRTQTLTRMLNFAARPLDFGKDYEGFGMPDPEHFQATLDAFDSLVD